MKPEDRAAFVDALVEHGQLAVPTQPQIVRFDVPPRPFAPFFVGRGNSVFTAEDA